MDVAWLHKYALELVWKEAEDKDWVGDGGREGAREQRGKEMKKEGREAKPSNATMCLQFTALKCKLGEINCACAIYVHASQLCDLCVETNVWANGNYFEI